MRLPLCLAAALATASFALAQTAPSQSAPKNEISAELGSCSVRLTVTGMDHKPVYLAKVSTRVQYGLMGSKRIDLEAFTDSNGQLTLAGLPELRKKPLLLRVSKDQGEVLVEYKPEDKCEAALNAVLPPAR